MNNRNLNILITGASSGIGEALALYYAQTSAKSLFICGRNADRLFMVGKKCEKLGATVSSKILDVTDSQTLKKWIFECEEQAPLNLVIANAGVATLEETENNVRQTFDVNVGGVVNTVLPTLEVYEKRNPRMQNLGDSSLDKFIHKMKKQKKAFHINPFHKWQLGKLGCELYQNDHKQIAIISSIAGYHGLSTCPSYSASKACVKAWGEGLRGAWQAKGIMISTICPGFVRSRITDKNTCPMPFFMETEKVAALIAKRLDKNIGLIAFPWQLRFVAWFMSILPNTWSDFIYNRLPRKV